MTHASSIPRLSWRQILARNALLIWLVLTSGAAYAWPLDGRLNPFQLSTTGLWALVFITMVCLGAKIKMAELVELRRRPLAVLLGVVTQCSVMPALAWFSVWALNLQSDIAGGVILVGCVPGAMASNVLTLLARGNVSYSISLTTIATLLSPITVPLLVTWLTERAADESLLDAWGMSQKLVLFVVLPVGLGLAAKSILPPVRRFTDRWAGLVAGVALLWIIASVVAAHRQRLAQVDANILLALLMINVAGLVGGWLVATLYRMPVAMRRALCLEVGMQNAGLGTALAASLYGAHSAAQIPTAAYTFGCMFTGTLLAGYWNHHAARLDMANHSAPTADIARENPSTIEHAGASD